MLAPMSATVRLTTMTRAQFLGWAEAQDERYEFDGFQPVAMTGVNSNHNRIAFNIHAALGRRLKNGCEPFGMDMGIATIGDAVRYPDAVVTCSPVGIVRLLPDPVVVFEVISPTSGHMDRVVKVREYAAVDSIRRYVIVESTSQTLTVHQRTAAGQAWTVSTVTAEGTLSMPEIGVEIPVADLYQRVVFAPPTDTP